MYVGKHSGKDARDRLAEHWEEAKAGSNKPLHKAMLTGFQGFNVVCSRFFSDDKELRMVEKEFITKYNAVQDGWNVRAGDTNDLV